jgi:hypothetical protein
VHALYVICVAIAASTLGACSENEAEKLEKIRDEMCACKTAACAEAALERVPKHNIQSTPRSQRVAREMLDCLAELYEQGQPTQDPDAPVEPAP